MSNRMTPWIVLARTGRDDSNSDVRARAMRTLHRVTQSPVDAVAPSDRYTVSTSDLISIGGDRLHVPVMTDLDLLQGPTTGALTLPVRLDGSAVGGPDGRVYDLSKDKDTEAMYRTVLTEATLQKDMTALINWNTLIRIWPHLRIPKYVREIWEWYWSELAD